MGKYSEQKMQFVAPPLKKPYIKYLGISLTNDIWYLSTEKHKTLLREMQGNVNKWKDIPCPWIETVNIVKMVILPNNLSIQHNPNQYSNRIMGEG